MKAQCATCPFREDERTSKLVSDLKTQVLTRASQLCHHPALSGRPETHLCRGARDFQLMIFYRLGFLSEPTDKAWEEKCKSS
jgi:hypothetical protein